MIKTTNKANSKTRHDNTNAGKFCLVTLGAPRAADLNSLLCFLFQLFFFPYLSA
jgi:hypothetical protein